MVETIYFEPEFDEKQCRLLELISDISQDCYAAAWMLDCEYDIWRAMQTGDLHYGGRDIDSDLLNQCRDLSAELDGWIVGCANRALPVETFDAAFVPTQLWLKIYSEHKYTERREVQR